MKNYRLKISVGVLVLLVGLMGYSVLRLDAATTAGGYWDNPQLGLEDVMSQYHKWVNDTFNDYTKKMLAATQKDPNDPNGTPLADEDECRRHPENYSTYCLSMVLLGNDQLPNEKGYFNYRKALQKRRNQLFDNITEKNAWNTYIKYSCQYSLNCSDPKNKNYQEIYQAQKVLQQSNGVGPLDSAIAVRKLFKRDKDIDREIQTAKQALDQALATYDQLRMVYPMHQQYVKIFNALVKYRDSLIEVRNKTDQFPARFTDVGTAKCT